MYWDSTYLIIEADRELRNPDTAVERVQELFEEWWGKRTYLASVQKESFVFLDKIVDQDTYVLPVKIVDRIGIWGKRVPRYGVLHFPKAKLSDSQIERLKRYLK